MKTSAVIALFLLCVMNAMIAQDLTIKAPPQTNPILIRGATLHTVDKGVIQNGSVLFDRGRITAVIDGPFEMGQGQANTIITVDGTGLHVYPGFVCAASVMGLAEIDSVDMTIDSSEIGDIKPEVIPVIAVNPDSWVIPVTRRNGVLTCGVMATGGIVPGRVSAICLDGWTSEQMSLEKDAGLLINWPFSEVPRGRFARFGRTRSTPGRDTFLINQLFDSADAYLAAREADPSIKTDLRLEAMRKVLQGECPVFINAMSQGQIEEALTWAAKRDLDVVLVGARDVELCMDMVKRHDAFVMLSGAHRMPHRRDLSHATTYELPAKLEAAGIKWCLSMPLSSSSAANTRNLPYEVAACVPYGLSKDAALRSITLSAAECLGIEERVGSLTTGKDATLFIADGDPFEMTTTITRAFIGGREIDLSDKQVELAAKYREKYRQMGLIEAKASEDKMGR